MTYYCLFPSCLDRDATCPNWYANCPDKFAQSHVMASRILAGWVAVEEKDVHKNTLTSFPASNSYQ